jgi:hypothetical protein
MSLDHTRAQLAALAASPEHANAGWRLGVADWVAEEVEEMFELEQTTVEYIRANWERGDRLAVVLLNRETNAVQQRIRTAEEIAAPRYQAHLRAANASGSDVFISMSSLKPDAMGRTKADIAEVRHVFLDVDGGGRAAVDAILHGHIGTPGVPPAHHVLQTSRDNHQMIWSVQGFTVRDAEALMRGMAAAHGADPAAVDASRVLRLPGFRNWKYEQPHYVREVALAPAALLKQAPKREYAPSDFPQYGAREAHAARIYINTKSAAHGQPGGATQSERDFGHVLRQLARQVPPARIVAELAAARPDKPNPQYYAEHTVANALRRRGVGFAAGVV